MCELNRVLTCLANRAGRARVAGAVIYRQPAVTPNERGSPEFGSPIRTSKAEERRSYIHEGVASIRLSEAIAGLSARWRRGWPRSPAAVSPLCISTYPQFGRFSETPLILISLVSNPKLCKTDPDLDRDPNLYKMVSDWITFVQNGPCFSALRPRVSPGFRFRGTITFLPSDPVPICHPAEGHSPFTTVNAHISFWGHYVRLTSGSHNTW